MKVLDSDYKESLKAWLDREDWSEWYAVTLTLRQSFVSETCGKTYINVDRATRNLRHFLNVINVKIFGNQFKRRNKRVQVIPVYEYDETTHFHFHLFIKKPIRLSDPEFKSLIQTTWIKTDWGLWSIDIKNDTDIGWLQYMMKDTSASFENVDFGNLWITD